MSEIEEIWKAAPDIANFEVSNLGRARSLPRKIWNRRGKGFWHTVKGGILAHCLSAFGYPIIGSKGINYVVHRQIAKAFIPNPDNLATVNHKNGIKTDNRVENLEWMSSADNTRHSRRVLGCCTLEKNGRAKLTREDVIDIRVLRAFGAGPKAISEAYGIDTSHVWRISTGDQWKAI